jgi:hypothetical protein
LIADGGLVTGAIVAASCITIGLTIAGATNPNIISFQRLPLADRTEQRDLPSGGMRHFPIAS